MLRNKIIICCIILCTVPIIVKSQARDSTGDFIFDAAFMKELVRMPAVVRDDFLDDRLDSTIHFRGIVTAVDGERRYRKDLRGIVRNDPAEKSDLNMTYYVFFNTDDSRIIRGKGERIDFIGKFMSFTPLNTKRDSYIFDIVVEKCAIHLE